MRVRPATAADAALIMGFVRELAAELGQGARVDNDEARIAREGFGAAPPAFEALIAEVGGEPAGMALAYATYSTWTGRRGLHVDDLVVRGTFRGRGVGEALLRAMAALAVERGGRRLDLQVVDTNVRAQAFYGRLGFERLGAWLPYRLSGPALEAFARGSEP